GSRNGSLPEGSVVGRPMFTPRGTLPHCSPRSEAVNDEHVKPTARAGTTVVRRDRPTRGGANMGSRVYLWAVAALAVAVPVAAADRPNVVLILADDFGYECVAADGGQSVR